MYEFTDGKVKHLYDRDKKLRFIDIDWEMDPRGEENLIVSYHNFDETPDLEMILSQMKLRHPKARYYKIATFANSTLDALKMLKFQRKHANVIGICMGEKGTLTRIMSPFTYAPLTESDKNASGQLLWSELETIYRYRSITPDTRIYGLIGDPVSQSIGHLYHNDRFRQLKLDAVYVKMIVTPEELPQFFEAIEDLPFWGFSVTAPLKQKITGYPANTLIRTEFGWQSCNTDGVAARDVLGEVAGKTIVILGSGGAAKAIESALSLQKAHVILLRRGMEITSYDILINATSSPNPDFLDRFIPGKLVMDVAIRTSPFLKRAASCGCRTMDGLPMYFAQAILQSKLWQRAV
ncbi:MAG: type I 3-dehydroquinate dehydratase [Rhabdochlamydiaceae bacterium]